MTKIFLSHSSKDKDDYVNHVYKYLSKSYGPDRVIIDKFSFEEGRRTSDEIESYIGQSDLIVLFISNSALESHWVRKEFDLAKKMLDEKQCQICPIIIVPKLDFSDARLPVWLKEQYNIQAILSRKKAADLISSRMLELTYEKNPKEIEIKRLFVGRNDLLNEIEERLDSIDKPFPRALIASGLPGIGRKTLLIKSVVKSSLVRESFVFPEITLDFTESIEDLILKISDLGFTESIDIKGIVSYELDKKIEVLAKLTLQLQESKEILVIQDNGCLINHEGEMAEWFYKLISSYTLLNKVVFLIVSRFKYCKNKHFTFESFDLAVPELKLKERQGLFQRLLAIEELDVLQEDKENISKLLTGYPKQVQFAVKMLKEIGIESFYRESYRVVDFGSKISASVLHEIQSDQGQMDLLILLCKFDYIGKEFICNIYGNRDNFYNSINRFYLLGIIEYLGISEEYIRVNDVIKDYISRGKSELSPELDHKLNEVAKSVLSQLALQDDISVPELLFSVKHCLLAGEKIDEELLLPSVYLSIMNELYHSKKYSDVVKFADKAFEREHLMEQNIIHGIRYLLCLALAQLRHNRFQEEVYKFKGPDNLFLYGFYYRKIGRFDLALEKYNKCIQERPTYSKAKREEVQVLIGMQDYDSALELAKNNYESYSDNPYHIQAYFSCIIKGADPSRYKEVLEKLISDISLVQNKIAEEMSKRMRAQYEAFINHDKDLSYELINEAILMDASLPYARMIKFDIAERFDDVQVMNEVLKYFDNSESQKYYSSNIAYMKSIIMLYSEKNLSKACDYFKSNVHNYTDKAINQVLNKFTHVYERLS